MVDEISENPPLTEAAKTSVMRSGVMPKLKNLAGGDLAVPHDIETLTAKALDVVEDLEKIIGSGKLDDADRQKLNAALSKLRGALQGGSISREALAVALSEASTAMGTATGATKVLMMQQKMDALWEKIGNYNKEIDDDFEHMRKAGMVFDEMLWNKHRTLSEYLQANPHDIEKQKALDMVDDQLLTEAQSQLKKCPGATHHFNDAKKKSQERHNVVDHDLTLAQDRKKLLEANTDADWAHSGAAQQGKEVTLNDVEPQNVGSNGSTAQKFVQKHTNVYFRTKRTILLYLYRIAKSIKL